MTPLVLLLLLAHAANAATISPAQKAKEECLKTPYLYNSCEDYPLVRRRILISQDTTTNRSVNTTVPADANKTDVDTTDPLDYCTDRFEDFRAKPFNLVPKTNYEAFYNIEGECLWADKSRVLVQSPNLTNSFTSNVIIRDLKLSKGCLVQGSTVSRNLNITLNCTKDSQCRVNIPCVVPRVTMTFTYKLIGKKHTPGQIILDLLDGPKDLELKLSRDSKGKCTIHDEFDEASLAKYRQVRTCVGTIKREYASRAGTNMNEFVNNWWPFHTYTEEVKSFLISIFKEFYHQRAGVFYKNEHQKKLKQFCKSLSDDLLAYDAATTPTTDTEEETYDYQDVFLKKFAKKNKNSIATDDYWGDEDEPDQTTTEETAVEEVPNEINANTTLIDVAKAVKNTYKQLEKTINNFGDFFRKLD